jgi:hypothetical protein
MRTDAIRSRVSLAALCRAAHVVALAAALVLLPACGGGGGSGDGDTPPPPPATYGISGSITNAAGGAGIAGVGVALTGARTANTTSDAAGHYSFASLPNGDYTVTPTLAGVSFSPVNRSLTITGANVGNVDFVVLSGGILVTGIEFLPEFRNTADQLRPSLLVRGGHVYFTDSSAAPLKRVALDGSGLASLATRFQGARNVLVRGANVYWVDASRLLRTPLAGGASTLLAEGSADHGEGTTADIVVDDSFAYWVNSITATRTWLIQKVPLGGGAPVTLATVDREVAALVADDTRLFWEEESLEPFEAGCNCGSSVKSVPKTGGSITVLVDGSLNGTMPPPPPGYIPGSWLATGGLALTATEVLFGRAGNEYEIMAIPLGGGALRTLVSVPTPSQYSTSALRGLAVNGSTVYFIDNLNHTLNAVALTGGSVTTLATSLGSLSDANSSVMVLADGSAYWSELGTIAGCCYTGGTGAIKRVPLGGGAVGTVLAGLDLPGSVSVAGANLAWTEAWRLGRAATTGGAATTIASGIAHDMARIAADATSLYVLDGDYVKKLPLTGGQAQKLAYTNGGILDDLSLKVQDIATDGTSVYWTATNGPFVPAVRKVANTGGPVTTVANEGIGVNTQDCYWRIALQGSNVYWSSGGTEWPIGCAVKKVSVNGGDVTTVIDYPYLADFTVDDSYVYFSDGGENFAIRKIPVTGGGVTLVAGDAAGWVMTQFGPRLYWVDIAHDTVGWVDKSTVAGMPSLIPGELLLDLWAYEAITVDDSGLYVTETLTGTIYVIR